MKNSLTIGQYLINQLHAHGVRHVFGIPGDYVLGFYDQLSKSKLKVINTCDEQGAGFAADAYARVKGLGAVRAPNFIEADGTLLATIASVNDSSVILKVLAPGSAAVSLKTSIKARTHIFWRSLFRSRN